MTPRRGASAVEFALTLPILLFFLAGVVEYGFFYVREANFRHAMHLAARTAAGTAMDDDPEATFYTALETNLTEYGFNYDVVSPDATVEGGAGERFLHVTATMPWTGLTPWPTTPSIVGGAFYVRMEDQES